MIDGKPSLYVAANAVIFEGPPLGRPLAAGRNAHHSRAEALETSDGLTLLERLGVEPPPRIAGRVRAVRVRPVFQCTVKEFPYASNEWLVVEVRAEGDRAAILAQYQRDGWTPLALPPDEAGSLTRYDRSALQVVPGLVETLRTNWDGHGRKWQRQMGKNFAAQFVEWLATVPEGVILELDPLLDSLRGAPVEAQVKLEVEEAGIDWFDLRVALDVA